MALVKIPSNVEVVDLTLDEPEMMADVEKMKRVFVNTFNAMLNGERLTIKSATKDSFVEISFTDTGVVISGEVLENIWTQFFTTKHRGLGLGLAICKRIVETHGGKISATSEIEKDSTFTVMLPIKPTEEKG